MGTRHPRARRADRAARSSRCPRGRRLLAELAGRFRQSCAPSRMRPSSVASSMPRARRRPGCHIATPGAALGRASPTRWVSRRRPSSPGGGTRCRPPRCLRRDSHRSEPGAARGPWPRGAGGHRAGRDRTGWPESDRSVPPSRSRPGPPLRRGRGRARRRRCRSLRASASPSSGRTVRQDDAGQAPRGPAAAGRRRGPHRRRDIAGEPITRIRRHGRLRLPGPR